MQPHPDPRTSDHSAHHPGPAVDIGAVKTTISAALMLRSSLPRYEELDILHRELVSHIQALRPLAEQNIAAQRQSSAEWHAKRCQLNFLPHELAAGLGPGLHSAARHVRSLGYTLRFLYENSGLPESSQCGTVARVARGQEGAS